MCSRPRRPSRSFLPSPSWPRRLGDAPGKKRLFRSVNESAPRSQSRREIEPLPSVVSCVIRMQSEWPSRRRHASLPAAPLRSLFRCVSASPPFVPALSLSLSSRTQTCDSSSHSASHTLLWRWLLTYSDGKRRDSAASLEAERRLPQRAIAQFEWRPRWDAERLPCTECRH